MPGHCFLRTEAVMTSNQRLLVTALLLFAVVQLSCKMIQPENWGQIPEKPDEVYDETTCEWSGGTWHDPTDDGQPGYSEEKAAPPAGEDTTGPGSNPLDCDATGLLHHESEILKQETDEFGTEICEYKITYTSDHEQGVIWLIGYQHEADIWQETDGYEWILMNTLDPGEGSEWFGYYTYYHDPDATGPSMLTLEKYAAIFKDPECESLRTAEDFLTWVAVEVPVECKK